MNGVKPAILPIVGIEVKTIQPIPITGLDGQLMENARPALTTVEIEISRELLRVLVENVKQAVQVNNEKAIRPSRFFSQTIDPCEQRVVAAFAVDQSGHRHRNVILDLEGDLCRCQCRPEAVQDDGQTRDARTVDTWLTRMTTYLKLTHTPDDEKVELASSYLEGDAYDWFAGDQATLLAGTFDKFKTSL